MSIKSSLWNLRKKGLRMAKVLGGAPRATGLVGLSMEQAQVVYGDREDVDIHSFVRKNGTALLSPKHLPEDAAFHCDLFGFPQRIPDYDAVVLDIRNSTFTFQHHHLIDDQRRVIYEPHLKFEDLSVQKAFLTKGEKLNGTVAYLGNTLFCQYAHWLQMQLPLLAAYWELFGKENIDYYYIGDGQIKAFAEESLLQMGIRREQIVGDPCYADRSLIAVKNSQVHEDHPIRQGFRIDEYSFHFLQQNLFRARPSEEGKKLFVMRGEVSGRRELNLPELRAALEPQGFRFVTTQGKTMKEEADLFGNADVIVAVHGAALHNLLFARPGTKVIEIFPYDYFEESNYVFACHGGFDYYYLVGEPVGNEDRTLSLMERNRADVRVNPDKLLRLCRQTEIL